MGGSTPEAGAAIFISLLPSTSTSSSSSGFSFRLSSIHRPTGVGRSYDLHPSCLAELPLSLPLTLSCPLPSPTDVRELDLLETRAASNGVFPPLLILTAPRSLRSRATGVSSTRRPPSPPPFRAFVSPSFGIISAVFYRSRSPGRRARCLAVTRQQIWPR